MIRSMVWALTVLGCLMAPALARPGGDKKDDKELKGAAPPSAAEPWKGLDGDIARSLRLWQLPGVAVGVVKDDAVVLARGYGVRKVGEPGPVDERTVFAIGSCTKAFTAAALAALVDEGRIKWDDPVIKHLPGFQLHDPYVTREVTVRDLLCHRSGIAGGLLLYYGPRYHRDENVRRLRHLKPTSSFRSKFEYQNLAYLAAGQLSAAKEGKSWDDIIRDRFLQPLGMTATSTRLAELSRVDNKATPHARIAGKVEPVPWMVVDHMAPAGSINSNVVDMAQWVRFHLGQGTHGKKRLLSTSAMKEMHTPQMLMGAGASSETTFSTYGLGWSVMDYRGKQIVSHGGGTSGMISNVTLLPSEKLGFVILSNSAHGLAVQALRNRILDAFLKAPARDWDEHFLAMQKKLDEAEAKRKEEQTKARVAGTKPSRDLKEYAGVYGDDFYGDVKIVLDKEVLALRYGPAFVGWLEHWHFDTFRVSWQDRSLPEALATFTLDSKGRVASLTLAVTGIGELTGKRKPDATVTASVALPGPESRKAAVAPPVKYDSPRLTALAADTFLPGCRNDGERLPHQPAPGEPAVPRRPGGERLCGDILRVLQRPLAVELAKVIRRRSDRPVRAVKQNASRASRIPVSH
jgi:CubicO group peptidase (beta-lactamase class C family)